MQVYSASCLYEFYQLAVELTGNDSLELPKKYFGIRKEARIVFEGIIAGKGLEETKRLHRRVKKKGIDLTYYSLEQKLTREIVEMATDWLFELLGTCHLLPPPCLCNLHDRPEYGCRSKQFAVLIVALQLHCFQIAGTLIRANVWPVARFFEIERRFMGDALARTAFVFNSDFPPPIDLLQRSDGDILPDRLHARSNVLRLVEVNHSLVLHSI